MMVIGEPELKMLQQSLQQAVARAYKKRQLALLQQEEYSSYFVGAIFLPQLGEGHLFEDCPSNPTSACYVGNFNINNLYSVPYNQGLRQHPNFAWSNQGASSSGANVYHRPSHPPGFPYQQPRTQATESSSSLENLIKEYIAKNDARVQSHDATLRSLENQIANALNVRPQGSLSSNTEDPRREGKERCKAILLRSGNELEPRAKPKAVQNEPTSIQEQDEQLQQEEKQSTN
ncbi:hypothetical protein TIFTF001_017130 [Ficus carica]|uniref:Uncharacterized protein n=1 Tax=Ficus carica TaxID=3494 RepID=A0AA88AKP7_FICCA|nr:hypothetical protein TIFTF001_017130 [Ficus carica]